MRILLVDDDETIIKILTEILLKQNYVVDIAKDGEAAWEFVTGFQYDLILLDVMLPKLDGISFCRRLREQKNPVLVMLLTGRDTTTDKLIGLDSGADDYIVKPFNIPELVARIRALIRRGTTSLSPILVCGDIRLDPSMHEVSYKSQVLQFSRKEYLLVELFLRNQKRVYSCRNIVDQLWSFDDEAPDESTVRSHIKNIRRNLKAVGVDNFLETVYGQGYRINPDFTSPKNNITVTNAAKEKTLDVSVTQIWEQSKTLTFERLIAIEQVLSSLLDGTFDENLCQQAIQNAHKLAGSLGMFNFEAGSILARKVEVIFQSEFKLPSHFNTIHEQKIAQSLAPLVRNLRQQLEGSAEETIKGSILIVDDTLNNLHLLSSMLEEHGYDVRCANSGAIALKTVVIDHPDIILLDVNMPNINGYEVCEQLKLNPNTCGIPVIFLSALSETIDKIKAFRVGGVDYITKPFQAEEVLARIENQLNLRRMQVELQEAKDQAIKALEQEQELNRMKSEFVSMISHDFRNPLTSIQGFAGLLESGNKVLAPETIDRYVGKINTAVDQLLLLLDEILLIGNMEAGKMQYKPININLKQFCQEVIDSLEYSSNNQHQICFTCSEEPTDAEMDTILLQRILTNLFSNAIKYSTLGTKIHFDLECQNQIIKFQIQDEGIGIPLENQSRLFEPFYRCSNVTNIQGTGLGLAIVKKCVEIHQGSISLESKEKLGTTFTISLPRYPQST